jgi:hypothetical protein
MNSKVREYANDSVDVVVAYGSYKQFTTAGKFDMRAHFRKALVSAQDSTGVEWRNPASVSAGLSLLIWLSKKITIDCEDE